MGNSGKAAAKDTLRGRAKVAHADRRTDPREKFDPIEIRGLTSIDHRTMLSRTGHIIDASKSGLLLHVARKNLVPKEFREALSIAELEGDHVIFTIDPLNLEIGGMITRTRRVNKDLYEIVIDFSNDAPEYWREALIDMLPRRSDYD